MNVKGIYLFFSLLFFTIFSQGQNWVWGTAGKYGGQGTSTATDKNGNVYAAGSAYGPITFDTTVLNALQWDDFLIKVNPLGKIQWAKHAVYGARNYAAGCMEGGIATDIHGNVYITGSFGDSVAFGPYLLTCSQSLSCMFLVKYDSAGNLIWAKQSTTHNGFSTGEAVATDKTGNIYVSGTFKNTVQLDATTLTDLPYFGQCAFIAKYDPNGNLVWVKQTHDISSSSIANMPSVAICSFDNSVYIAGLIIDSSVVGSDTLLTNGNGGEFLAKYDSNGNFRWARTSTVPSGASYSRGSGVNTDNSCDAYIAGGFVDTMMLGSLFLSSPLQDPQAYIAKYTPSGNISWAKPFIYNNRGYSWGWSIARDMHNHIYFAAEGSGNSIAFGPLIFTSNSFEYNNLFLVEFDTAGTVLCGSELLNGGSLYPSVTSDSTGNFIYCGGVIGNDTTYFVTDTIFQSDVYVTKWTNCCSSIILHDTAICHGASCNLVAPGGVSYDWSNNATSSQITVSPVTATTYSVISVKDTCSTFEVFNVNVKPPVQISSLADSICLGDSTIITVTGGTKIFWSNRDTTSSITVKPFVSTAYTVSVNNGACIIDTSITVEILSLPAISITPLQSICLGASVLLSASGGGSYSWSNGATTDTIKITPTVSGIYFVVVSNNECSAKDSVKVIVSPISSVTLCCDSNIVLGEQVQLISSGGGSYSWSPSAGLSCDTCPNPVATPHQTTTYILTITSDSGCAATKQVTIDVRCGDVFIPDVFSPNEAHNNVLYVRGPCIQNLEFEVFDRWGNKIFESQNPDIGWDGSHNGTPMNMGTYMYYVKATMYDGSIIEKHGNVTLVR